MKLFKISLLLMLVIGLILPMLMVSCSAAGEGADVSVSDPMLTTENYTVYITGADSLSYVRFALGAYASSSEIKKAPDCVTLNSAVIRANTTDSVLAYEMPAGGVYSFWIKCTDGREKIFTSVDMTVMTPSVTTDGVNITVSNFYGVSDLFIAKGSWSSYQEIKNNGYIARFTSNKLAALKSYTYTVKEEGDYTVLVRFSDRVWYDNFTIDCVNPVFSPNGLQLTVGNLEGVKCIRTAYGEYSTISAIKKADTHRAFTSKGVLNNVDKYTVQYREPGKVTAVVQYNNGYYEFFVFDAVNKTPTCVQKDNSVTFGDLEGLKLIRYAPGEHSSSADIKNAEGSKVIKASEITESFVTVTLDAGVYTFCVQYEDESYNYFLITVAGEQNSPAIFTKELAYTDAKGNEVTSLPYWLYTPANAKAGMPLIVVLHSAHVKAKDTMTAEENLDNMVSSADDLPKFIYDGVFGDIPAYIVMPQTSGASLGWAQRGAEIKGLVEHCKREYGIDADSIGIMGYSLGGTGAIELACAYPELFSNVLSVAGGIDGVTNHFRPYIQGQGRLQLSDSLYPLLRVVNDKGTYEKNYMKYLYAAEGNKYKAEGDAAVSAISFAEERIAKLAEALRSAGTDVWLIAGSLDAEVKPEVSAQLCDAIASDKAKCDTLAGYSHAKALTHCLTVKEQIIDFIVN